MNNNKKIYFWAVVSKIMIVFMSVVTTALINRALGVELKGEYAYITNLVNVLLVIFSLGIGMTYGTFKRTDDNDKDLKNAFYTLIIIQAIIPIIVAGIIYLFKNVYVSIIMILTSVNVFKFNLLYITAVEDVKKRDKENIIYKILYMISVIIAFLFFKKSLNAMLVVFFLDAFIVAIGLSITYSFRIIRLKNYSKSYIFNIYKLGIISMLMQLMISLNYNLDVIVLKKLTASYYVGLYSVAVNLGNMLWIIPDAFKDVLFHKTSKDDSIKDILFLSKLNIIIALIIIVGFIIFGRLFIKLFYGIEFIEAFGGTLVLFFGCLSMIVFKMIHPLYIAKGKQHVILIILIISVLSNLILNYIFIPKYNIYGASISSVFSYSICGLILLFIFSKDYKIKFKEIVWFEKDEINKMKNMILKKIKK